MRPLWTSAEIAAATSGVASADFAVSGADIDSRDCTAGSLFIALGGEATDGHRFIGSAFAHGASAALISDASALDRPDRPHVRVADTRQALEALARAARARNSGKVIAVTGSAGKTSVKEALRLALDRFRPGAVHASIKSFNNHVGVPLTLVRMPADAAFSVLEMGMNHAGELTPLSQLGRPHVAIITTIAAAHQEYFANEEAIADAKAEIFAGVVPGGTIILNADNRHFARLQAAAAQSAAVAVQSFGWKTPADVRALNVALKPTSSCVTADIAGERMMFKVGQPGAHWVLNALAVLAGVRAVEGDLGLAGLALADMAGLAGRGRRISIPTRDDGEAVLLDESYNANPASMTAALAVLGGLEPRGRGRRIAVLADMKEMGETSPTLHAGLADAVESAGVAQAICIGPHMRHLAEALPKSIDLHVADDAEAAWPLLKASLHADDVVLVKGSNSMGLGKLVDRLIAAEQLGR